MNLLHMAPARSSDDVATVALRDSEHYGDLALQQRSVGVEPLDFDDVGCRQFGHVILFPALPKLRVPSKVVVIPLMHAPLQGAIDEVVLAGTSEQMERIHAAPDVAVMQHMQRGRIVAVPEKEGESVRRDFTFPPNTELPVALRASAGHPQPALRIGAPVYFGPESTDVFRGKRGKRDRIFQAHVVSLQIALVRAVAAFARCFGSLNYGTRSL